MVYYLFFEVFREYFPPFNVFRYISFRAIYATITALVFSLVFGPFVIGKLQQLKVKQFIRDDGPKTHHDKAGTPTMGGILILTSVLISVLLWSRLNQPPVIVLLLSVSWFGLLFTAGFTPLPFKVFTITSGVMSYNLPVFFLICLFTRGLRFFLVAYFTNLFGQKFGDFVEKKGAFWFTLAGIFIIILAIVLYIVFT